MPKTRPPYPAEFREQIIELARGGRTPSELSSEFGVSSQAIRNRLRPHGLVASPVRPATQAAAGSTPSVSTAPLTAAEREELARLRRGLVRVKMERDILAKACGLRFAARGKKTPTSSSS